MPDPRCLPRCLPAAEVDKTSVGKDLFRQSSPGTHADTETVIRQVLGKSRGSKKAGRRSSGAVVAKGQR